MPFPVMPRSSISSCSVMMRSAIRSSNALLNAESFSLWTQIPIGIDEQGMGLDPPPRAQPPDRWGARRGKSVALSSIVAAAALDPKTSLTLLDGKRVELSAWEPIADRFVGPDLTTPSTLSRPSGARWTSATTSSSNPSGARSIERARAGSTWSSSTSSRLYLRGGKKESRDRFAEALETSSPEAAPRGSSWWPPPRSPATRSSQPSSGPLLYRMAMRCTSPESSDTIFGQGWASRALRRDDRSLDPRRRLPPGRGRCPWS